MSCSDLHALLEEACELHGSRTVFRDEVGACSYTELGERCARLAGFLHEHGITRGQRVAAFLPNCEEYLELYFACARLGAILVPLNLRLHARELREVIEDAQPRLVVVGPLAREAIEAALADLPSAPQLLDTCSREESGVQASSWAGAHQGAPLERSVAGPCPEDPAQLYYTSGTTGRAKGVVLTHANVTSHALAACAEFELVPDDVWGHFAPMFHLADAWASFAVTIVGGRHAFLPSFDSCAAFAVIEEQAVTLTNLVPTMLQRMVRSDEADRGSVESMRMVLSGGAPIAPELVRRVQQLLCCEYVQTYGLTETSPFLTVSRLTEEILQLDEEQQFLYRSRTGRAFGGIELRVVGDDGAEVPTDDQAVGEIWARGPWVFGRYWQRPEETCAAFEGDWFKTGDLATREVRGYLNIVDRKKDVILTGGETVYSTEVENALYSHALVEAAAVFALPDDEWGEIVAAAVVRGDAGGERRLELGELIGHCRLFLPNYKLPRVVYFVDGLPLSGSGKVQKRLLRQTCQGIEGEVVSR